MTDYDARLAEIKHQREEALKAFYELLEVLESNTAKKPPSSGFPFNLLEQAITAAFLRFERLTELLVTKALRQVPQMKRRR